MTLQDLCIWEPQAWLTWWQNWHKEVHLDHCASETDLNQAVIISTTDST